MSSRLRLVLASAGGFNGNGCVGEYHSPGTSPFGNRTLFDAKYRLAGDAIQNKHPARFAHRRERRNLLPVFHDIHQPGRGRQIIIPKIVMDHLEVPFVLSGVGVDSDDRIAEQVRARAIAAVVIRRSRAEGDVNDAALFVGGQEPAPGVRAGAIFPAVIQPAVVADLRPDLESIETPTASRRAGIEGARISRRTVFALAGAGADQDQILEDGRHAVVRHHHVEDALFAESRIELAAGGI